MLMLVNLLICSNALLQCTALTLIPYKEIHINQSSSIAGDSCVCSNYSFLLCQSFSQLNSSFITNSTQLVIYGKYLNLSTVITFENVQNLKILGYGGNSSKAIIHCKSSENSGINFKHIKRLFIYNISIQNCGAMYNSSSISTTTNMTLSPQRFRAALYVENCTGVNISDVDIINNNGVGAVMYNTRGNVIVRKSLFRNNKVNGEGGGGMYIELSSCPIFYRNGFCFNSNYYSSNSQYLFEQCTFSGNQASTKQTYFESGGFRTFGQGGGLLISPQENSYNNTFRIINCFFYNNKAVWGGGLHLFFAKLGNKYQNNVYVTNTTFDSNESEQGGGGMTIYFYWKSHNSYLNVSITVSKCRFISNVAKQGGGTILVSPSVLSKTKNISIKIEDSLWIKNSAIFSSAVDVTGTSVVSVFFNCEFISNKVYPTSISVNNSLVRDAVLTLYGNSAFMVTCGKVFFKRYVRFGQNSGTALLISGGAAIFSENMTAIFEENTGVKGGAISLLASAYLRVSQNSCFNFFSNKASVRGGAIYSSTIGQHELHEHIGSLGCFIQVVSRGKTNNISFVFSNNTADNQNIQNHGNSIFASSLLSCASYCFSDYSSISVDDALTCTADFTFINSTAQSEVASSGSKLVLTDTLPVAVVPGKEFELPLKVTDRFNNEVRSTLRAYIKSTRNDSSVRIDVAYTYISEKNMKLYGLPGEYCHLLLERVGYHTIAMSFAITLDECPPGFVIDKQPSLGNRNATINTCVCASNRNQGYRGLTKCRAFEFQAFILHGYWAGYDGIKASEDTLLTAACPLNFCTYNSTKLEYRYKLPSVANKSLLSQFVCKKQRTGFLCGSCVDDYSIYFHSPNYVCGPNKYCSAGAVFYILSELIPLVILFVIIMIFDIKFTSGKYNGFIFYAQVIDYIGIDATELSSIPYTQWLRKMNSVSLFVYRVFNLNFFSFDYMSFCLWKDARMLDIIIFKFITIIFALLLVLLIYLSLNICNLYRVCRLCPKKISVIHGLSTFLVMCYAQCVQISFQILTPVQFYGKDGDIVYSRVFYSGDTKYFNRHHTIYAVPAILCIVVVVIIPTFLLLWYPAGQRALAFCRIGETRCIQSVNKLIPVHRIQPFLDSFQSCFKDNFRFFAGLYLAYRFCVLVCNSFSIDHTLFYVAIETLFVVILLLHSMAQPYKKRWHNVADSFYISILAMINGSSILIYNYTKESHYQKWIIVVSIFRSFLVMVPLLGILIYGMFRVSIQFKNYVQKKFLMKSRPSSLLDEFPARMLDEFKNEDYNISYQRHRAELDALKAD